jgi:streptogramin lyase
MDGKRRGVGWALGAAAWVACGTTAALAGEMRGVVHDASGAPIAGAIVSLADDARGVTDNVYSDAKGRFRLATTLTGDLSVRVRKAYFDDLHGKARLTRDASLVEDFAMVRTVSDADISENLPAAYHFGQIDFKPGTHFAKDQFQRDCLTCHQLGNAFTRRVRTADDWETTIQRMHGYMGNFDADLRKQRAALLASAFNGVPLKVRPTFPFDPLVARATLTEYRLDKALIPHDAEVGPKDDLIYIADQQAELMAITDLKTGKTEYYPAPHEGMNEGGKFARLGLPALLSVYRGPHSLAFAGDRWYTTDTIATQIGVFNAKTRQWEKSYDIPGDTLYPHTIRADAKGVIWFTIIATDQVGRLDPATGQVKVIPLPAGQSKSISPNDAPYGIDVDPKDGSVWYAKLYADKIGRIDPATLKVTEWDSPVKGPRRMRFDRAGDLWVTGYSEGKIARLTPRAAGFASEVFDMPEFAPGYRPAPYALGVDPVTQEIWVNETMTDHLYRFIPKEKRWVAYPMPLRGTYTREVTFTRKGLVCTSNNPIPIPALEGGVAELVCIDPDGAAR